jgi:uncharacterized protein YlxW (UPF0749 family)
MMGSVIFVLLAAIAALAILWRSDVRERKAAIDLCKLERAQLCTSNDDLRKAVRDLQAYKADFTESFKAWRKESEAREAELEAEIQRLQKISLTPPADEVDNSVIRAKSPAQVRQLTETAWGLRPDKGLEN